MIQTTGQDLRQFALAYANSPIFTIRTDTLAFDSNRLHAAFHNPTRAPFPWTKIYRNMFMVSLCICTFSATIRLQYLFEAYFRPLTDTYSPYSIW